MKQFLTTNFKWIVIAAIAIVLFVMWKGCGNNSVELTNEWKARYDSMTSVNNASERKVQVLEGAVNEHNNREDSLMQIHDQDKAKWNADMNKLKRFSTGIKTARENKDTVAYKLNCDSCGEMYEDLSRDARFWEQTAQKLFTEKDSTKIAMQGIIDEKQSQINALQKTVDFADHTVIPGIKRRLEWYGGIGVIGNQQTIFSGYEGSLSILTRKGQIWEGGVQWIKGVRFYKAAGKFRLSFRKH